MEEFSFAGKVQSLCDWRSLREVRGCISVGVDLKYFEENGRNEIAEIKRIERLLAGYVRYVEKKNVK